MGSRCAGRDVYAWSSRSTPPRQDSGLRLGTNWSTDSNSRNGGPMGVDPKALRVGMFAARLQGRADRHRVLDARADPAQFSLTRLLCCPHCQGRRSILAFLDDPIVVHRILRHVGPMLAPSAASPWSAGDVLMGGGCTDALPLWPCGSVGECRLRSEPVVVELSCSWQAQSSDRGSLCVWECPWTSFHEKVSCVNTSMSPPLRRLGTWP